MVSEPPQSRYEGEHTHTGHWVRAEIEGQPVLMAREVQFDGQIVTLRDVQGLPMRSGPRRGAAK